MFIFIAPNESVNEGEKTELSADIAAAVLIIPVKRAKDYSANAFVRVGRRGKETTELRKIDSISGNNITLTVALTNAHEENEEVVELFYDQRKIYKEDSVGAGAYTALAGITNPKDIELDNPDGTIFKDADGSASYRYKCTYYNSQTSTESAIADAEAVYGGDSGAYCSISDIRSEAGFQDNQYINDGEILKMRKRSTDEIDSALKNFYSIPLSYVPEIINDIALLLSAGRLLTQQYSGLEEGIAGVGKEKLREARETLKKITKKELILLDADGDSLVISNTGTIKGWPNTTTEDESEDDAGGDHMFTALKKF